MHPFEAQLKMQRQRAIEALLAEYGDNPTVPLPWDPDAQQPDGYLDAIEDNGVVGQVFRALTGATPGKAGGAIN